MSEVTGSIGARALAVSILLVSYGALGARQPAVRTSVPLPVPAQQIATHLGLDPGDRGQLLVSIVRLLYDAPDGSSIDDQKRRVFLMSQLSAPSSADARERVPLPLDTSIWRETLLARQLKDSEIVSAILSERSAALLYHGLASLDDDTLGWLGPDRETLLHLRRNAAVFASFGRSIKVRGGRVSVPGGPDAEAQWAAIVGVDPSRPAAFVQRIMRGNGRLAWFYDTIMHLDPGRQLLVFGARGSETLRTERLRELLDVFEAAAPEWHAPDRPFVRPGLDPSLVVSLVAATRDGSVLGPESRRLWDSVFRDDSSDAVHASSAEHADDHARVEPAWLARRISLVPAPLGQRRLQTFLFAQRVFADSSRDEATLSAALRGASAFPALALTLERIGLRDAASYAAAARTATTLNGIRLPERKRLALSEFQSALAIIDRSTRSGSLEPAAAARLATSLIALPVSSERGYGGSFTDWLQQELLSAFPVQADAADPLEDSILAACAGVTEGATAGPIVEWEGRRYRVDPAAAEFRRLHRVRERQRAAVQGQTRARSTLDARIAAMAAAPNEDARLALEQAVADTLVAIVYATGLGEPEGPAASAGNASGRHDFGLQTAAEPARSSAWRLPREEHGDRSGWRVVGSLLGLDVALGRLALRRLDFSDMPGEPTMSTTLRASATLTVALAGAESFSDGTRDEIAAAIERGRARVKALRGDQSSVESIARDAGLSEWRREGLAWTVQYEHERVPLFFSLIELFWLGAPRGAVSSRYDPWGAATTPLDGCLCLRMPGPTPWEARAGRSSTGHLATRGADVNLRIAEFLAESRLPAALAPGILAYAMQHVLDVAQPAFFDDWPAFERAARDLPRERLIDFVAALAADGALIPVSPSGTRY